MGRTVSRWEGTVSRWEDSEFMGGQLVDGRTVSRWEDSE
jgi:hypothetical protein